MPAGNGIVNHLPFLNGIRQRVTVSGLAYNSTAVITPEEGMILPEGGSYTVAFYGADGKPVATPLTISDPAKQ